METVKLNGHLLSHNYNIIEFSNIALKPVVLSHQLTSNINNSIVDENHHYNHEQGRVFAMEISIVLIKVTVTNLHSIAVIKFFHSQACI